MPIKEFRNIWIVSVISFIIAALTGVLYRFGMLYPLPDWIHFVHIRHAHSHLMFFNWVSPPLMLLIASRLLSSSDSREIAAFRNTLWTMLVLGFLSYPFFLLYGYQSVEFGSLSLPLAAILSGLVMCTWYRFAWLYFKRRQVREAHLSDRLFDGALIALMVSSLGAWGVSLFQFTPADNPLVSTALTHFFLALFTEGWALLGALGILWQIAGIKSLPIRTEWLWQPILFGSMLIFPYSLPESLLTPAMIWSARIGSVLIASGTVLNLALLLRPGRFRGFSQVTVLSLLALKALTLFVSSIPAGFWPGEHGLRILYLHLLLLGIVSVLYFNQFISDKLQGAVRSFTGSVLLVLLTLAMISGYWPAWLLPAHLYHWVYVIASLPILPVTWILIREFRTAGLESIHQTQ